MQAGAVVKILAAFEPGSERFWVEITGRVIKDEHVHYYGVLRNNLLAGYLFGTPIGPFEPRHILNIDAMPKEILGRPNALDSWEVTRSNIVPVPVTVSKPNGLRNAD